MTYGGGADARFDYNTETDNIIVSNTMWNVNYHSNPWNDYNILLKNNFNNGNMYLNDSLYTYIPTNGITDETREATTFPNVVTANDNQTPPDGYKRLWSKWSDDKDSLSRHLNYAQNFSNTANFKREFHVTFRNYYGSTGNTGGIIKVRGTQVNSSSTNNLVTEGEAISAEALNQTINYVALALDYWSDNLGTNPSVNPTPPDHKIYTAYLKGKPNNGYRNLSFNYSEEGQPVKVTWSKHPLDNSDVTQYAVYRKVTTQGTPTLLTTVTANGSNTYTYTDYDYTISSADNKIILFYDVRAYYSPNQVYSDVDFGAVYGVYNTNIISNNLAQIMSHSEVPTSYSFSNYPNPFNPSTVIKYQLPENSFVSIKVYDMLGKEVAELVNGMKQAGYYEINFNAGRLSSGIYICTIKANHFSQSKKMILAK